MNFCNSITIDEIPNADFTSLLDFVHSFTEEDDDFSQIMTVKKLTSLNFIYREYNCTYTIQFCWDSQTRDDAFVDKIKKLFSTLKKCIIEYDCKEKIISKLS
jgi:hypothetical protein